MSRSSSSSGGRAPHDTSTLGSLCSFVKTSVFITPSLFTWRRNSKERFKFRSNTFIELFDFVISKMVLFYYIISCFFSVGRLKIPFTFGVTMTC